MHQRLRRCATFLWVMALLGCGVKSEEQTEASKTSMDVDIPKEGVVTPAQLKNINVGFSGFIRNGKYDADTRELVESLKIEDPLADMLPAILETRQPTTSLDCNDRRCRVISRGQKYSFLASWINIPLFGKPTVSLDEVILLELVVSPDAMKTEVCRLSGIRAKAGFLNANVDGLKFELEEDAIKEFVLDTGSGGSFPTDACNPQSTRK